MASTADIRTRLEYLMDNAPGIMSKLNRYDDNPTTAIDPDAVLPAYFIGRAGRAEHENSAGGEQFTSRRWLIWIVAAEVAANTIDAQENADEAAEALLDDIVWYLRQHEDLDYGEDDNGIVQGISIKDDGVKEYQRATKRYAALPIMLDIASIRSQET